MDILRQCSVGERAEGYQLGPHLLQRLQAVLIVEAEGPVPGNGDPHRLIPRQRHRARAAEAPAVLVVPAKGAALSILAVIQGFLDFQPDSRIRGVILNRCTAMTCRGLAEARLSS